MALTTQLVRRVPPWRDVPASFSQWLSRFVVAHNDLRVLHGTGSPETVVTANIGALYLRDDGVASTVLYIKESGSGLATGWIAK